MAPDEESKPPVEHGGGTADPGTIQRGRPSGRGHRGRGRRGKPKRPQPEPTAAREPESVTPETRSESHELPSPEVESFSEAPLPEREDETTRPSTDAAPSPPAHAASTSAYAAPKASVQMAIEDVNRIIESLRESLDDMDAVLEMLEEFERQSNADDREIESLRRALRHLQRPREGGGHPHRGR